MERTTNREWDTIRRGRREIKIGIAKDAELRNRSVDLGIPGRVVILDKYPVDKASRVESQLHNLFADHRFTIKGAKRGAGGTEFFRLTNREIRQARQILDRTQRKDSFRFLVLGWIVAIIIVLLIHYYK